MSTLRDSVCAHELALGEVTLSPEWALTGLRSAEPLVDLYPSASKTHLQAKLCEDPRITQGCGKPQGLWFGFDSFGRLT